MSSFFLIGLVFGQPIYDPRQLQDKRFGTVHVADIINVCFYLAPRWQVGNNIRLFLGRIQNRCIFAGYSVANDIVEFFHDGDTVYFADAIVNEAADDIEDIFEDIGALIIPKFSTIAIASFLVSALTWQWRTNGQSGATGHEIIADGQDRGATIEVMTDTSQLIEVKASASDASTLACKTEGWKFPVGT